MSKVNRYPLISSHDYRGFYIHPPLEYEFDVHCRECYGYGKLPIKINSFVSGLSKLTKNVKSNLEIGEYVGVCYKCLGTGLLRNAV